MTSAYFVANSPPEPSRSGVASLQAQVRRAPSPPAAPELVEAIVAHNRYRRARRTPAGHLIVRTDTGGSGEADWRFLGPIEAPPDGSDADAVIRLRLRMSSGRRVIALEDERSRGAVRFALGPEVGGSADGGQARDRLLAWVRGVEADRGIAVKQIFWDGAGGYWIEVGGERITFEGALAPLEFRS